VKSQTVSKTKPRLMAALFAAALYFPTTAVWADDITVAAAASLTDVLQEISKAFHTQSRHKVVLILGSSSTLARQIEEGAPADVFMSADLAQMENLEKKGLLEPGSPKELLSNQLVLIIPFDSSQLIATPKDLQKPAVKRIGIAQPSVVPAGVYSKEYLTAEKLWDKIASKVIPLLDVRATLAAVESGSVDAGFVYRTDAAISKKVKIVHAIPIAQGPRITYPVAIITESKNKAVAREFVRFIQSPTAKRSFEQYGFLFLNR
jgi:molybdate transport system substrate-binding protein